MSLESILYVGFERDLSDRRVKEIEDLLHRKVEFGIDVDLEFTRKLDIPGSGLTRWLKLEGRAGGYFGPPAFLGSAAFRIWYLAAEMFDALFASEMWYVDSDYQHWIRFDKETRDRMLRMCPWAHHRLFHLILQRRKERLNVTLFDGTEHAPVEPAAFDETGVELIIDGVPRRYEYSQIRHLH